MNQQSNTLSQALHQRCQHEHPIIPLRKKKPSFVERLKKELIKSEQNPQNKHLRGIFWVNEDQLAVNSFLLGRTLNLKPNTINRNLRNNNFKAVGKLRTQLAGCPKPRNWRIFIIDQNMFNRNNEEQIHVNNEEEMNKESSLTKESHSVENQNNLLYKPTGENEDIYINIDTEENSYNLFDSNCEGNQDVFFSFNNEENQDDFSDSNTGEKLEDSDDDFYIY